MSVVKHSQDLQPEPSANRTCNVEVPRPPSLELPYKLKSSKNTNRERKDRNVLKRRTTDKLVNTKGKYYELNIPISFSKITWFLCNLTTSSGCDFPQSITNSCEMWFIQTL